MKRVSSNKPDLDSKNRSDAMRSLVTPSNQATNPAASRGLDPDHAVERGSQALARYSSRRQFAAICRWLVLASILILLLGIVGYLAYPSISQVPWQKYLDRFDLRLQPAIEPIDNKSKADPEESPHVDP